MDPVLQRDDRGEWIASLPFAKTEQKIQGKFAPQIFPVFLLTAKS
jgi:hypothetical protein